MGKSASEQFILSLQAGNKDLVVKTTGVTTVKWALSIQLHIGLTGLLLSVAAELNSYSTELKSLKSLDLFQRR